MIAREDWHWCGYPGHFICADSCHFRMTTEIGGVLVSTVGDYHVSRESEMTTIGAGRFFETFVFALTDELIDGAGCGCHVWDGSEIDTDVYQTGGEARSGHMAMCEKWATLDGDPARYEEAAEVAA